MLCSAVVCGRYGGAWLVEGVIQHDYEFVAKMQTSVIELRVCLSVCSLLFDFEFAFAILYMYVYAFLYIYMTDRGRRINGSRMV